MTDEKNCCSLPLYDSPDVCSSCHDVDGVTVIQGKKGTGMGLFSAWLTHKLSQISATGTPCRFGPEYFGRGRVYPRYLDGEPLEFLRLEVEQGNFLRADGRCLCSKCNRPYGDHPAWQECPTFVLLCDSLVVKL